MTQRQQPFTAPLTPTLGHGSLDRVDSRRLTIEIRGDRIHGYVPVLVNEHGSNVKVGQSWSRKSWAKKDGRSMLKAAISVISHIDTQPK